MRLQRIKADSLTCNGFFFTSSQLQAFLSTKHQHPDHSTHTKLIQTSSTLSIRSDKQTRQWIVNKFKKGDARKSFVLAAATSLSLEVFVLVTRSRTKEGTHPVASLAGGTRDIPTTRYQKRTNTQPTSILGNAPGAKYQPQYTRMSATCADHAEKQRWRRHFLDGYGNLCARCRPCAPCGSGPYTGADAQKFCGCCEKCKVWCMYCLNQEKREKSGRGVSRGLQW
jgi:hypothetical protein